MGRVTVAVPMRRFMVMFVVRLRAYQVQICEPYTSLSLDFVRKRPHRHRLAFQDRALQTGVVIKMNMRRRDEYIVMTMLKID